MPPRPYKDLKKQKKKFNVVGFLDEPTKNYFYNDLFVNFFLVYPRLSGSLLVNIIPLAIRQCAA